MHKKIIPRDILETAWQDVLARDFQTFAYYHWWQLQSQNPSLSSDSSCITIKNAALESSLMSIRDLDDFFLSRRKKNDDLIAADYGVTTGCNFLAADERAAINKKLAHLTYQSAYERHRDPHCKNPRIWNNAEMVERANRCFLEFLDHLENTFFKSDKTQREIISTARDMIVITLKNIKTIAGQEMEFKA